ncbi:aldose epimerase family protein [Rheinheimera sp. NSM]|uniref:aldose epimerase family protein n=1 Tax=Rheinheimera sp. NSM TaxID=3457884 RepID=UPI0040366C8C
MSVSSRELAHPALAQTVQLITLDNGNGLTATLSTLGAGIWSVTRLDESGTAAELVLNYQDPAQWATNRYYFGVSIGRVANRIADAAFVLDGKLVRLRANEGTNQLHGGPEGLGSRFWQYRTEQQADSVAVIFSCHSAAGDQGFPGNVALEVCYRLNRNNELSIDYYATTDKLTPLSLTNHCYWNLAATPGADVLGHTLWLNAGHTLQVNEQLVPDGNLLAVANTAFDFQQAKTIGRDIAQLTNGYDHFFVLNNINKQQPQLAAVLTDPGSGRAMDILTTEAGIQFYSGNFLDGSLNGADGLPLTKFAGLCLETHAYPNAVNLPQFPSILITPAQPYRQRTIHRFYTQRIS